MEDKLLRGIFPQHELRFAVAQAPRLVQRGLDIHQSDPVSGYLLSQALLCSALLSTTIKGQEKLTLRWIYDGPIGTVLTDLTPEGHVRGQIQMKGPLGQVTRLEQALGKDGQVAVVTSTPERVVRTGITPAVFFNLPQDLAHFFSLSYQLETVLAAGIALPLDEKLQVAGATGLMVQPLPSGDLQALAQARQRVEEPAFQHWLDEAPRDPLEVLARLELGEPQVLEESRPGYVCGCSVEKTEAVLEGLGQQVLREMIADPGSSEITCQFCGTVYVHSAKDLHRILQRILPS